MLKIFCTIIRASLYIEQKIFGAQLNGMALIRTKNNISKNVEIRRFCELSLDSETQNRHTWTNFSQISLEISAKSFVFEN